MQGRCLGAIWPILGDLALFFRCLRYNLRIVTDIAIVGPRTLVTAGVILVPFMAESFAPERWRVRRFTSDHLSFCGRSLLIRTT